MSWLKLDDGFADHPKVLGLSDAAFRLHVRAMCWCAKHETDGKLPKVALRALGSTTKLQTELTGSGLWVKAGDDHEVHDYLKYNPSKAQREAEREANRSRVKRHRNAVTPPVSNGEGNAAGGSSGNGAPVPSRPVRKGDPPNPPKLPDPFGDSFRGTLPGQRSDVHELHAAWKQKFGLHGHRLRMVNDGDAKYLADAIDAHGFAACMLVLAWSHEDGMVSGRDDEQRVKHESLGYIFGNEQAFARMLRHAEERQREAQPDESAEAKIARLKGMPAGAA